MNLNGRKIKLIRVHETFQLVGVSDLKNPIESTQGLELDMTRVEGGVHIIASKLGKTGECFIPDGNCKGFVLCPELAASKVSNGKA